MELQGTALVLDRRDWSDRHLLVKFLFANEGTVRCVVRGARSRRGGDKTAATQVLSEVDIRLAKGPHAELWTLREIELVTSSYPLAKSLLRAGAAAAVAETLSTFNLEGDEASKAFRLGSAALGALLAGTDPELVVTYVQAWSLQLAGLMPDTRHCSQCEQPLERELWLGIGLLPTCRAHAAADAARLGIEELQFLDDAARRAPINLESTPSPGINRWFRGLIRLHAERRLPALAAFEREIGESAAAT